MADFPERSIPEYLESIRKAISNEDGRELSRLLSIDLAHRPSFIRLLHQYNSTTKEQFNSPFWTSMVESHMKVIRAIHESRIKDAFDEKVTSNADLSTFLQAQKDSNWYLLFMTKHAADIRKLAIRADSAFEEKCSPDMISQSGCTRITKKDQNMEKACDCLMALFRICVTDTRSAANSKRVGIINIINQLFKIYFRINKLHLCKALIRALENSNTFNQSTLAQKVTYNYYLGIKTLFDLRILEAEKLLDYVFENCHPESFKNIRLTLIFLIPIKMLLGRLPSKQLMEKYDLHQFQDIKKALLAGKIGDLDKAIEEHSEFLWRYGIYLIIERLRPIALRNLFKKVSKQSDSHLIDLNILLKAVRSVQPDEEVSLEEVHCMLSNLIYEGKIKGYLSIGHQKLVLSKKDPFPPISELAKNLA